MRPTAIPRHTHAATLIAAILAPALHAQQPRTGAEQAGFENFTTHEQLLDFLYEVQSRSDRMLVEALTVTDQGRIMPIVYLGAPPPATPGTAWFSGKPTLFFTGNVHGNERAGREGSLQLIRELAIGELTSLLDRVNVLIVPTLNPDGAMNRSRTNSLGYDMNRDFIVAETPEIAAVLEKVLTRYWPDVFVDVHNGGSYPYNITYQATLHPAADSALVAFARGPMYNAIQAHLNAQNMKMYWYSGPRRTETGWVWRTTPAWARKQHTYGGLQNMITLLFEVPGRWSLGEQATHARETMEGLIRFAADNAQAVRSAVMGARQRTLDTPPAHVVVQIEETNYPEPEQFWVMEGGEPTLVTGMNGTLFVPTSTRARPWAYAFDRNLNKVADFLRRHAIQVEQLEAPVSTTVDRYRVTALEWETEPYQNHLNARAEVQVEPGEIELPAGTYLVRMNQHAARLIAQLFEPDTDDSLVVWNFLDHDVSAARTNNQGELQGGLLPLYRIPQRVAVRATLIR